MTIPHASLIAVQIVPWVISGMSLVSQHQNGRYRRSGWLIGIFTGIITGSYNIYTHQLGFVIANGLGTIVAVRNYLKWGHEKPHKCTCRPTAEKKRVLT